MIATSFMYNDKSIGIKWSKLINYSNNWKKKSTFSGDAGFGSGRERDLGLGVKFHTQAPANSGGFYIFTGLRLRSSENGKFYAFQRTNVVNNDKMYPKKNRFNSFLKIKYPYQIIYDGYFIYNSGYERSTTCGVLMFSSYKMFKLFIDKVYENVDNW